MNDTLIIGAGPAGLTAAYELSKLGCHATILEAGEQVGGLSRTVNYQGFRFDIGGHRFSPKSRRSMNCGMKYSVRIFSHGPGSQGFSTGGIFLIIQ